MRSARNLLTSTHATAALEFCLLLPMLMTLVFATMEIGRIYVFNEKTRASASAMSDFMARTYVATRANAQTNTNQITAMMRPLPFDGRVIISAVQHRTGERRPRMLWQYFRDGGGRRCSNCPSQIGPATAGSLVTIPFATQEGDSYIITEVYQNYQPLLANVVTRFVPSVGTRQLYHVSYQRPRQGTPSCDGFSAIQCN